MQTLLRKSLKATSVIFFFAARIVITEQRRETESEESASAGWPFCKEVGDGLEACNAMNQISTHRGYKI
jgi:hypothetical protein